MERVLRRERHPIDDGARNWLRKAVRTNYWRVAAWQEYDDLIHDGYVTWYRIVRQYPHVRDRPQIMRLFQVAFTNHLHDLSKVRTRTNEVPVEMLPRQVVARWGYAAEQELIARAPPFAQLALIAITECPPIILRVPYRVGPDGHRETLNDRLCKLVGLDPTMVDLIGELKKYLLGVETTRYP